MRRLPVIVALIWAAANLAGCGIPTVNDAGAPPFGAPETPVKALTAGPAQSSGPQAPTIDAAAQTYTAMTDPKSKSYKIGPLDVLEVTVFKVPDLSKSVQVSEAGTINYPLIGEIMAGGKSARELEQELTIRLGSKYLQKPQITVFVKEYNSQRVTVTGAVKKPGVVPIAGGMTLVQAIAQSGGLDELAENSAVVFRVMDGKRAGGRYDLADIQAGRGDDPLLQSGDVVVVTTSDLKYGANTVLRAIPLATLAPLL